MLGALLAAGILNDLPDGPNVQPGYSVGQGSLPPFFCARLSNYHLFYSFWN